MSYSTRCAAVFGLSMAMVCFAVNATPLRESLLRKFALQNGLVATAQTHVQVDGKKAAVGELLFKSKLLSLSGETACGICHLDNFGSADGIPNAIGTGGKGEGTSRLVHGGDTIPRNTLALWGRGGVGFTTFFWDGKVEVKDDKTVHSQFGEAPPSNDPLEIAAHLPLVEIREMIPDQLEYAELKKENRSAAEAVFRMIEQRVRSDTVLAIPLSKAYGIQIDDISVSHIASSLSAFIRRRFRLQDTRFHDFVFNDGILTDEEIRGGLAFYGNGKCVICHNGPYFSDFKFHAIPTPQLGFGKNGFGIDYGRYNVTLDPEDIYKFRTPPLINVFKTAPFGHSGSLPTIRDAIIAHIDPLSMIDTNKMTRLDRVEFYNRLTSWSRSPASAFDLSNEEVDALVAFLKTLNHPN